MEIITNSKDIQNFFKSNELGLTTLLSEKGFNVGSFKIGQGFSEELSKDDGFSSNERNFSGNQSRGEGRNQDSQRRAKLWQQYQDKLGA